MNQLYEQIMDVLWWVGMGVVGICTAVSWAWNKMKGKP